MTWRGSLLFGSTRLKSTRRAALAGQPTGLQYTERELDDAGKACCRRDADHAAARPITALDDRGCKSVRFLR